MGILNALRDEEGNTSRMIPVDGKKLGRMPTGVDPLE
jgi:hypothetical protein